jgi:hypothetical protein
MAQLGKSGFTGFSVPLVFDNRYFIMEPGNPKLLTVVSEKDGEPFFEVLRNTPQNNPLSEVVKSTPGIITVSAKSGNGFLYRIHPGPDTRIAFVKADGGEITARITESTIGVGGITLKNNTFIGDMTGVSVMRDGRVSIGARVPLRVMEWLRKR